MSVSSVCKASLSKLRNVTFEMSSTNLKGCNCIGNVELKLYPPPPLPQAIGLQIKLLYIVYLYIYIDV